MERLNVVIIVIRECFLAGTGIQFHRSSFAGIGMNPKDLFPFVVPRPKGVDPTTELVKEMKKLAKHESKIEVRLLAHNHVECRPDGRHSVMKTAQSR